MSRLAGVVLAVSTVWGQLACAADQLPAEAKLPHYHDVYTPHCYRKKRKLAGRVVPSDETFTSLLTAMDQHRSKMTSTASAKALSVPPFRLRGLLAVVQRILNIDGLAVLTKDDALDTVELNRALFCHEFDLVEE